MVIGTSDYDVIDAEFDSDMGKIKRSFIHSGQEKLVSSFFGIITLSATR